MDVDAMSLLTVHVTELVDGVYIGCGISHFLADANSFWHFFNMWSHIFKAQQQQHHHDHHEAGGGNINTNSSSSSITRPPILDRWFPEGHGPLINFPSTPFKSIHHHHHHHHHHEPAAAAPDSNNSNSEKFKVRTFHFSSQVIEKLKAKANSECESSNKLAVAISRFQSLSAFLWKSITRVRNLKHGQITTCLVPIDSRSKLEPPLSQDYFGNCLGVAVALATAGELAEEKGLGVAARKLHRAVVDYDDKAVRTRLHGWLESPMFLNPDQSGAGLDPHCLMINGSTKFDAYGNEFGMGKAVSFLMANDTATPGKIMAHSGREEGSVDLEICLPSDTMEDLQSDRHFMEAATATASS